MFTYLNPGDQFRWTESIENHHAQFVSLDKTNITETERNQLTTGGLMMRYNLTSWSTDMDWNFLSNPKKEVVECQNIPLRWCGD